MIDTNIEDGVEYDNNYAINVSSSGIINKNIYILWSIFLIIKDKIDCSCDDKKTCSCLDHGVVKCADNYIGSRCEQISN